MTKEDELKELNLKIHELSKKRDEINKDKIDREAQFITSLSWTKDYEAELVFMNCIGAGMSKYQINLIGPDFKLSFENNSVLICGSYDMFYSNCIMFNLKDYSIMQNDTYPCLKTSNTKMLIDLINKREFKNFRADWDLLEIMKVIEAKYGN